MAWWRVWKTKKQQPEKKKRNLDHLSERARVIVKASRDPEVKINELLEDLKVERRGHDFDFPKDPEKWTEMDMQEFWGYRPLVTESHLTGWNPMTATPQDWIEALREKSVGRPFYVAPYYIPFRREYPVVPENEHDIATPKDVIEELDRMEEFLTWVSFIFPDGSSYEGTIWDDHANGKGVYISPEAQFRYEGEWFQNLMDGHGVLEFDIPEIQPVPGSDLEDAMRARGKIIKRDYMSPEDQKWLEMDIEDSLKYTTQEVPYYERNIWKNIFGKLPEKGRYKYAGQWKHGRMHGCGVYEVNERIRYGRFYFGIHLNNSTGCHADVSMAHAGLAEVAAAKARMFVNKPDGMIREYKGPYSDPQHPYLYEDEDVWMAPGFINQFYEVPDYWKTYVEEVDQEREMWLNSFYKAPLRIPMPAELEYWWENDASPEFIVINKEPIPDPEDPSKLIYDEDPLIYHTRSKKIINYVDDEEHGIRLFWQPPVSPDDVENFDMKNVRFLPPGFDEFYGKTKTAPIKKGLFGHLRTSVDNSLKPMIQKIETWIKNNKEASERNLNRIQEELKLVNSRLDVEEEMEDLVLKIEYKQKEEEEKLREEEWKLTLQAMKQREEERKQKMQERRIQKEEESKLKEQTSKQKKTEKDLKEEKAVPKQDMEVSLSTGNDETENDKEDADEEQASSSFGAAFKDLKDEKTEDIKPGKDSKSSPFSSLSLSLCTQLVPTLVTTKQKYLFSVLKEVKQSWTSQHSPAPSHRNNSSGQNGDNLGHIGFNIYAWNSARPIRLRAVQREPWKPSKKHHRTNQTQLDCLAQILSGPKAFN